MFIRFYLLSGISYLVYLFAEQVMHASPVRIKPTCCISLLHVYSRGPYDTKRTVRSLSTVSLDCSWISLMQVDHVIRYNTL